MADALPKPIERIRDPEAVGRKVALDPVCRMCKKRASDGHHVVLRSQGGDDVEDNIVPLCHACHMRYHGQGGGFKITRDEYRYVIAKMGLSPAKEYLRKRRIST